MKKHLSTIVTCLVSFILVGSMAALFLLIDKKDDDKPTTPAASTLPPPRKIVKPEPTVDPINQEEIEKQKEPPAVFINLNSPRSLAQAIANTIRNKDANTLKTLEQQKAITAEQSLIIKELMEATHIRLSSPGITSIGANNSDPNNPSARYSLNFSNGARGYLDIKQNDKKQWELDKLTLPDKQDLAKDHATPMVMHDPMGIANAFINAVVKADFRAARKLVNPARVSDATIAGMCILFEEGDFRLRDDAPIKTSYETPTNAGFFIYLQDANGKKAGNIGLTVAKENDNWLIAEASLDNMLEAYAQRQGAGDDIFIPIVKNPKGGDSLALFFGFNEDSLSKRSIRQLQIVAEAIKADGSKKLEISGHTDDVGSARYNQALSERRADAVKATLVEFGVPAERIITKGFGKSRPRRTYSGTKGSTLDDARKENRRAELYLDF